MEIYKNLLNEHIDRSKKLDAKDRQISVIRLILIISVGLLSYQYFQSYEIMFLLSSLIIVGGFIGVLVFHQNMRWENSLIKQKIKLFKEELSFLSEGTLFNDPGTEFIDPTHAYSYDLDFFGERSIFQHINRTSTIAGKRILAHSLLKVLPNEDIKQTQIAIKELSSNTDWRFTMMALGQLKPDTLESYKALINWSQKPVLKFSRFEIFISFLSPILLLGSFTTYLITSNPALDNVCFILFFLNLGILATKVGKLKEEMLPSTEIDRILKHYSMMLKSIESRQFESSLLNNLKKRVQHHHKTASLAIAQLSKLFLKLDHLQNVFASPLLNGTILFHFHILRSINQWRKNHATHVEDWLEVIGKFEQLNSLANFSFNNPEYIFPELNNNQKISFSELGHPLISKEVNVKNDIHFNDQQFFILTGSNMSGKSTFLRTLGINMVLSGIGSPIYAKEANVQPLPVLVSMRLSDSLTDSESYFYAEVKRLKHMMDELDHSLSFVLLDEILRGTNSDDKRNGTLGVIRKLVQKNAIGGIATHDLEVCNIASEFPGFLINKRFEVEIVNDELEFDYKLKDGICENKSASFIMERMEII